jgi:hypothetical protein
MACLPLNKNQKPWGGEYGAGKNFNMKEEFAGPDFHSLHLEQRFGALMKTLYKQPDKSDRKASEDRGEDKASHLPLMDRA